MPSADETATSSSSRLRSVVRVRPFIAASDGPAATAAFQADEAAKTVTPLQGVRGLGGTEKLTFDDVVGPNSDNASLYARVVEPTVGPFLRGRHSCLLAYGQTGSGKTHTVFGWGGGDEGVVPRTIRDVFERCERVRRGTRYRVAVSFIEVYCERVNDLLDPATPSSELPVRETAAGACFVPNATVRLCYTPEAALRLLALGNANKAVGNSYVHDKSSRSHTIFTLMYAGESSVAGEAPATVLSRYSFVDLAGSEMLSDAFGQQQQSETKAINLSLLALRGVMDGLDAAKRYLPYRESVLTRLLSQPLSHKGSTVAVSTVSPAAQHATLSAATLRFADVAGRVRQQAEMAVFVRNATGKLKIKDAAVEEKVKLGGEGRVSAAAAAGEDDLGVAAGAVPQHVARLTAYSTERVRAGAADIHVHVWEPAEGSGAAAVTDAGTLKLAVVLHAYGDGCDGTDFDFVVPLLAAAGYTVVGPDLPGFGATAGRRQASRTAQLWDDPTGPLPTVEAVLRFAEDRARRRAMLAPGAKAKARWLVLGHDWGGNMALSLAVAARYKAKVSGLVLFHPSWTEKFDALAGITTTPTLLCWVPSDQLHLIASGRRMAQHIRRSKLVSLVGDAGKNPSWGSITRALYGAIAPWLRHHGFLAGLDAALRPPGAEQSESTSDDGEPADVYDALERMRQLSEGFGDATGDDGAAVASGPAPQRDVDDYDDEEGEDDTNSTQSSFLACLLADPMATDELIAARARALEAERRRATEQLAAGRLRERLRGFEEDLRAAGRSPAAQAVVHLRHILAPDGLKGVSRTILRDALLGRGDGVGMRPVVLAAVGSLPVVVPFARPGRFTAPGLWQRAPRGIEAVRVVPRYPRGRRVFVPVRAGDVWTDITDSQRFGRAKGSGVRVEAGGFLTSQCYVCGPGTARNTVAVVVLRADGGAIGVEAPLSLLDAWNGATAFPAGAAGGSGATGAKAAAGASLLFEDAIRASYASLVMRAKVAECAVAVEDLAGQLDFGAAAEETLTRCRSAEAPRGVRTLEDLGPATRAVTELQLAALQRLRAAMDCTHHVQVGRDLARLCVPDCGKLATFGQWHCHGMASVFASLLLPFASTFAWDVRYRDGFFLKAASRDSKAAGWDGTPRAIADHTWLEVTLHPSGLSFVVDPSFTDDGEPIALPLDAAYSAAGCRYPVRDLTNRAATQAVHQTDAWPLHDEAAPACL